SAWITNIGWSGERLRRNAGSVLALDVAVDACVVVGAMARGAHGDRRRRRWGRSGAGIGVILAATGTEQAGKQDAGQQEWLERSTQDHRLFR
ncbi:hypothetical protein XocVXO32_08440, partial [Xanthomonas oryzae pv. oryzicola]